MFKKMFNRKGTSLIELLITVTIIAGLSGTTYMVGAAQSEVGDEYATQMELHYEDIENVSIIIDGEIVIKDEQDLLNAMDISEKDIEMMMNNAKESIMFGLDISEEGYELMQQDIENALQEVVCLGTRAGTSLVHVETS